MASRESDDRSAKVKLPAIKFTKLFIDGQFVDAVSGRVFDTIDPRTEEVIAQIAEGDKADVDLAVKAARAAFDHGPWPQMSGSERGRLLMKFADLIDQNADELATLEALDAGRLLTLTKCIDIPCTADCLRYYAGAADKIHGETLKMPQAMLGHTWREPVGVAGLIVPWNFPSFLLFACLAPALAAGCTVVVKPAEQASLNALYNAHLAKLAGIPDGVLNVITGFGPTAGAAIASHMDVDKISFTGSTEVGRSIMEAAARSNLKSVTLELGGKSPLIIFDDADVDMAVDLARTAIFFNKGEACMAGSRALVQEAIYDEFVRKSIVKAKEWVVGDPFEPHVNQGPQIDRKQFEKVLAYIEHGKREGATLLTGGRACGEKGFYIEPTIFADVEDDMMIAKDEIFGPVLCIMKFKSMEEGIAKANKSSYGLAAGVVTKDLNVANTVARSIKAGMVLINCYHMGAFDCPFGGYKMSGFGRTFGLHGLDNFLQVKSVVTPLFNSPWH
ncbi:aldehyde dehydrogenase family 2 member C4-like [Nymphaea colorata]|nr:aldehyde dehydrogenase family 2 member C4-like [Nymphaea colorata]